MPNWVNYSFATSFNLTWLTMDINACEVCKELNGETWELQALTGVLTDAGQGAVYDLDADVSLTHDGCRCFLFVEPIVNLEESETFRSLQSFIYGSGEDMPSNIAQAKAELDDLEHQMTLSLLTVREFERVMYRTLALLRKMGMPEDVQKALTIMSRMVMIARVLSMTITFLHMGTGYGMAMGILGLGMTFATAGDLVASVI